MAIYSKSLLGGPILGGGAAAAPAEPTRQEGNDAMGVTEGVVAVVSGAIDQIDEDAMGVTEGVVAVVASAIDQVDGDDLGVIEFIVATITTVDANEGLMGVTEDPLDVVNPGETTRIQVESVVGIADHPDALRTTVQAGEGLVDIQDDAGNQTSLKAIILDGVGVTEDGISARGVNAGQPGAEVVRVTEDADQILGRVAQIVNDGVGVTEDALPAATGRLAVVIGGGVGVTEDTVSDTTNFGTFRRVVVGDDVGVEDAAEIDLTVRSRVIGETIGVQDVAPVRVAKRTLVIGDVVATGEATGRRFFVIEPRPMDAMLRRAAKVVFSKRYFAVDAFLRRLEEGDKSINVMVRWSKRDTTDDRRHPRHSVDVIVPRCPDIGVMDLEEGDTLVVPSKPDGPLLAGTVQSMEFIGRSQYRVRVDF